MPHRAKGIAPHCPSSHKNKRPLLAKPTVEEANYESGERAPVARPRSASARWLLK